MALIGSAMDVINVSPEILTNGWMLSPVSGLIKWPPEEFSTTCWPDEDIEAGAGSNWMLLFSQATVRRTINRYRIYFSGIRVDL